MELLALGVVGLVVWVLALLWGRFLRDRVLYEPRVIAENPELRRRVVRVYALVTGICIVVGTLAGYVLGQH